VKIGVATGHFRFRPNPRGRRSGDVDERRVTDRGIIAKMPARKSDAPHDFAATTIAAESGRTSSRRSEPDVTALAIAWCAHEPHRVGELAVVSTTMHVFGRGAGEDEPRLRFFRPRPGTIEPTEPIGCAGLSRRQLEIRLVDDGVEVRRVGRCAMRHNGVECDLATLRPGDALRLRQEIVLLCVRRAARIAACHHFDADDARFGAPDALGILGESPTVWALRDAIAFAAKTDAHVLCIGETGTGKELAARAVHQLSARSSRPLVARNAATLPPGLIDAELFGNVRNYPNAGMPERPGLLGHADGGFLFLDEIAELSSELQSHLLRVLDSGGEYQRLGESTSRRSDLRLIAATNRDPAELRRDLLARFKVQIELPPLGERREDIPLLVRHLVLRAAERTPEVAARFVGRSADGKATVRVDAKLIDQLIRRDFKANMRELEAVLWSAIATSESDAVEWSDAAAPPDAKRASEAPSERRRNEEPTEEEIRAALARESGNVARAAKALGLSSRYALYRMMTKLGIDGKGDG
jgi:DNA-binding NtrC family response regulator